MVERLLLLINTASGTGHPRSVVERLRDVLTSSLGQRHFEIACAVDHDEVKRLSREFVARTSGTCALVVGGGNGTLRAAIEGIADAAGDGSGHEAAGLPDRVVVGALRLGSGNLFARQFGAPADPEAALRGIVDNLITGRLTRCQLMRCDVEDGAGCRRLYATSMIGFGSFGRVPSDLDRWRVAYPRLRRLLARLLGIERLNGFEYAGAFALRALRDATARRAERPYRLSAGGRECEVSLLAGALVKFDFAGLPITTNLMSEQPAAALALVETLPLGALLVGLVRPRRLARRAQRSTLSPGDSIRLETQDGQPTAFFLDEDPATFDRAVTLRLSSTLRIAPGPEYRWPALLEVSR